MPNIKSAKKRVELTKVANARNKAEKSMLKTNLKKFDAAVPSLLDLADDADPEVARLARAELLDRVDAFFKVGPDGRPVPVSADWRGYNLVSARAKALLLQNWDRIQTWRTAAESREG